MLILFDKTKHYDKMVECWKQHNHWIIPKESLSDFGLVYENNNEIVAFSFVYLMSNSKLAQLAWTTTNKNFPLKLRYKAVNEILDGLIAISEKKERETILCFSSSSGLNKLLHKKGLYSNKKHDLYIGGL